MILRFHFILGFAIILTGCASKAVRYADRSVTPSMIQDRVKENRDRVSALSGSGTISVETTEMAQSGSFDFALQRPDSLLVKIEGPFGIDVGSALITRNRFYFYNSFQNRLLEGSTSPSTLTRVFQIPLDFDDILNMFTGGFFLQEDRSEPSSFSVEDEEFVLTFSRYTGTRRYWVDPQTLQIVKIQHLDGTGKLTLEQLFTTFATIDGVIMPHYVRVTMHKEHRRVSVAYAELFVNPANLQFSLSVPQNATRGTIR